MSVSGHSYRASGSEPGSAAGPTGALGEFAGFVRRSRAQGDAASDTSSQQERNFANLLGGYEDKDDEKAVHIANVGHRLYHVGCEKQRHKQELLREEREKTLMKEMSSLAQRPSITSAARERPAKGHTFAEHTREWSAKRDEKVFRKMLQSRERDESEVTAMPQIDSNSLNILENAGTYVDPVNGWDTHYAKYCAKQGQPLPKNMFQPNINSNAVRADADQSIHDRLHGDSIVRADRLRDAAKEQRRRELEDPATGRPYFSPQSLRPPTDGMESPNRAESIVSRLHDSSKKVLRQKDPDYQEPKDPESTFQPKINPKSTELAERVRRPLYTPGKKKDYGEEARQREESVNRSSRSESKVHLDEFFRRTSRCDHVKEARLDSLRKEKMEREDEHCVFQPKINRKSEELFKQAHVYGKPMATPTSAPEISTNATAGRMQMEAAYVASPNSATSHPRTQRGTPSQQPMSAGGSNHFSTPRSARKQGSARPAGSPAASRGAGGDADASGMSTNPGTDDYMTNFENQMNAVLDEWRRLEEV